MSQVSGVAGRTGGGRFSSSGRAALLLALAVVVGVIALQQIDELPEALPGSATQQTSEVAEVVTDTTPVTAPQARPPAEVKVLVANGVGVDGAAARIAGILQPLEYQLLTPGNTTQNTPNSAVQYAPGYEAEGRQLAESMKVSADAVIPMTNPAPVADLQNANVVLIIGSDLANQAQQAPTTTTPGSGASVQPGQAITPNAGQANGASSGGATAVNGPLSSTDN